MTVDARQYRVYVEPLAERLGGGYVAYAPELTGCVSDGETPGEALANIYDAVRCWIDAALSAGEQVPAPVALRTAA